MEDFDPSFWTTYSQNREDIILYSFFKDTKKGFYVDIGAGHPIEDSVTKLFYDLGWRGINIDPIKKIHTLLEENRPEDTNLNIGLSNKKGELKFREYENYGQSTFASDMKDEYEHSRKNKLKYTDYKVNVDTLANVLTAQNVGHINFLKVDAEGLEYEILEGNNWSKFRPEVICIEANHILRDWRPLLSKNNYTEVFNDGINNYYVAKEASSKRIFSYTEAFLGEIRPVDFRIARVVDERIALLNTKINGLITENHNVYTRVDQLEYEKNVLNDRLIKARGTKMLIKTLYKNINNRIENIIYPSHQEHTLRHIPGNIDITLQDSAIAQLKEINNYDDQYLAKINTAPHRLRKIVLYAYKITQKILIKLVKTTIRVLRNFKRLVKK